MPKDPTNRRDIIIWPEWTPWPDGPCCPGLQIEALYTASIYTGVAPMSVNFTNLSSNALYYIWDFNDSVTSTDVHPSHIFDTGSFNVILSATGSRNNTDTYTATFSASMPTISINFQANTTESEVTASIEFLNTTTYNGSGTPIWLWNFGDAATSTSTSPTHSYSVGGTRYTVSLQGTGSYNISGSHTKTNYISVIPALPPTPYMWYKSNIGLYTDDGITSASMNSPIYRWDDQTGNGFHMYQTSSALRPLLRTATGSIFNGRTGLLFDSSNDYLYVRNVPFGSITGLSMFLAVNFTSLDTFETSLAVGLARHEIRQNPAVMGYNHFNVGQSTGATGINTNYTMGGIFNDTSNTLQFWFNGTASGAPITDNNAFEGTMDVTIGGRTDGTLIMGGYVSEVIIYNRTLSASEIGEVFAYLNYKYR